MKRKTILLCLLLVVTLFVSCASKREIKIGMSYDELDRINSENLYFNYRGYVFYVDSNGDNAVAEFGKSNSIETIKSFPKVKPSRKDFLEISNGMTVYEVVERVGIPFRTATFGVSSLDFKARDGSIFRVCWSGLDMTVIDVYEVEN